jgi:hypothetical protein
MHEHKREVVKKGRSQGLTAVYTPILVFPSLTIGRWVDIYDVGNEFEEEFVIFPDFISILQYQMILALIF